MCTVLAVVVLSVVVEVHKLVARVLLRCWFTTIDLICSAAGCISVTYVGWVTDAGANATAAVVLDVVGSLGPLPPPPTPQVEPVGKTEVPLSEADYNSAWCNHAQRCLR